MNAYSKFHPVKNAAILFAPLRVQPNNEAGGFDIWTKQDDRPGTLGNFVLATTQDKAEAHLFAAAPEMHAALRGWIAIFGGCVFNSPHIDGLLTQARAAIAQAEGRA
jgi:hypothetical protein